MPPEYLAPGVFVEEIPSHATPIPGVSTSTTVFIGWTNKGPVENEQPVINFADFEHAFGGLDQRSLLGYSVRHFFENGGSSAYIIRIADDRAKVTPAKRDVDVLTPNTGAFERHFPPDDAGGVFARLDKLENFNILAVPGEVSPAVIARLQAYCRKPRAFLIVDSPEQITVEGMMQGPDKETTGPDAINSALYFPWLTASDPLQPGSERRFPPNGFVAGIYACTDVMRGVQKAPAGSNADVRGATGVSIDIMDSDCAGLNLRGINCIRAFPDGIKVWGAQTLLGGDKMESVWKCVNVRRLAIFLEESIYRGLQWAVFEPNNEQLWKKILWQVDEFMFGLWRQGALVGYTSRQAYFVKCGLGDTMTLDDINNGHVICVVGFAPLKPTEFIVINIQLLLGKKQACA